MTPSGGWYADNDEISVRRNFNFNYLLALQLQNSMLSQHLLSCKTKLEIDSMTYLK